MLELKPSDILYSQDSILNRFRDSYIRYIGETLDQLLEVSSYIQNIPNIEVVEINGKLFSMDNRRLWVYKKAEELGSLETIDVIRTSSFNRKKKWWNINTSQRRSRWYYMENMVTSPYKG
jgi:hypothetical protein